MIPTVETIRPAFAPRYQVERVLGRGAMAVVFLATDAETGAQVAVKVVRPELAAVLGPDRFHREVQILQRLQHPGILPLLDSGDASGFLFLVMPYVAGENLRARLDREGQLSIPATVALATDVAAALDYAHAGNVLHRDIKPENILLKGDRALVCDFGLARALDRSSLEPISSSGLVLGTPAYMSPEQALARAEIGKPTDIYALGCVLYEALTGGLPFTGSTLQAVIARHLGDHPPPIRTVRPEVSAAMERAVLAALAKEAEARPRSGAELISMLTR